MIKDPPVNTRDSDAGSTPGSGRSLGGGLAIHSSILAWRVHEQGSLVGYHPQGRKELDTTEAT